MDASGVPSYSSTIALDPQQQALLDKQRSQQMQRSQIGSSFLGQVDTKPLDLSHLNPIYDRYGSGAPQLAPPAQPAASTGTSQSRDQMLQMLQQYMASQGQPPGLAPGGNPAARQIAGALTGGSNPVAQGAPTPAPTAPPGSDPYGRLGSMLDFKAPPGWNPQSSGLPDYLQKQFQYAVPDTTTDQGNPATGWQPSLGAVGNSAGVLKDKNGQAVFQVGDPSKWQSDPDSGVKDPSKVRFDPDIGYVTSPDNMYHSNRSTWQNMRGPLAMFAGGVAGAGLAGGGFGFGAGDGTGVGTGAFDVGGSAGFGGSTPLGAEAAPAVGAPVSSAAVSPVGNFAPVADASAAVPGTGAQPGLGSQLFNNWSSGRGLLGLRAGGAAPLLAQLLRGMGQQGGGR
jgi:hypothetical protein